MVEHLVDGERLPEGRDTPHAGGQLHNSRQGLEVAAADHRWQFTQFSVGSNLLQDVPAMQLVASKAKVDDEAIRLGSAYQLQGVVPVAIDDGGGISVVVEQVSHDFQEVWVVIDDHDVRVIGHDFPVLGARSIARDDRAA